MRAGNLRNYVTLQTATGSQDGYGESTPTWASAASFWAEIVPVSARELDVARGFAATVTHRIRIRYRGTIASSQRILFGSRVFAINGVLDPDGRRREELIYATEQL